MKTLILVIPLIGAVTAWLITTLIFKMLFWPREYVKLPFGIGVRGLLPQKRDELAAGVRQIIETQLRFAVTGDGGLGPEVLERLTDTIAFAAREHVYERTPVIIPKTVKTKVADLVDDFIRKEMPGYVQTLTESMQKQDFAADICTWAQGKINSCDLAKLELRLNGSREVFYLKAGAVSIGAVSGLLQVLIMWAVSS